MRIITVAGPPSCGKTSVMAKACGHLAALGQACAVVKFDCLQSRDDQVYREAGVAVSVVLSGGLCPDHFYATNLEEALAWAKTQESQCLVIETAGLCNRCSPHIRGLLGICVMDNLMGIDAHLDGDTIRFAIPILIVAGDKPV